ncbi:MAG: M23 family metallopeptidase [Parvularculaceae bacterium]
MRRELKFCVFFASTGFLAACATTPSHRPDSEFHAASSLYLCSGVGITNAPVADASRRIVSYTPAVTVRGVSLLRAPVTACVSSGFGPRRGGAGSFHDGVDLYTGSPHQVVASGDGEIAFAKRLSGYGLVIEIQHANGVTTRYAHLSSFAPGLRPGARVHAGDFIGETGRTGNATAVHLHYEIRISGRPQNPLTIGQ